MSLPFEVKKLNDEIVLVIFDERSEMCDTLIRFQEYYENPKFRDRIFTLGELRESLMHEFGGYTYKHWVDGCNIPGSAFLPFLQGLFDPLTPEEAQFLDVVCKRRGSFYVIAVYEDYDKDTLTHEECHALYGTNDLYRYEVDDALAAYWDDCEEIVEWLYKEGYCTEVIKDEVHAYVSADAKHLEKENIKYPEELVEILQEIKSRFPLKDV